MNKNEYWSQRENDRRSYYKHFVNALLEKWKQLCGIKCQCVIHHIDDRPDAIEYNEKHYELWGFNEDETFEYGKYVVFMTRKEHTKHHFTGKSHSEETNKKISDSHKGEKNYMFGKHLSEEVKEKLSYSLIEYWKDESKRKEHSLKLSGENATWFGKSFSESHKKSLSDSHIEYYKNNPNVVAGENNGFFGKHHKESTKIKMSEKHKNNMKGIKLLYNVYKSNNGKLVWNEFQSAIKSGDVTFEMMPTSVFAN